MKKHAKQMRRAALLLACTWIVCVQIAQAASVVAWGSRGEQVMRVQQRLQQWGYYDGAVDGVFGEATEQAVRLFPEGLGLPVSGVVARQTWQSIFDLLDPSVSAS